MHMLNSCGKNENAKIPFIPKYHYQCELVKLTFHRTVLLLLRQRNSYEMQSLLKNLSRKIWTKGILIVSA